MDEDVIQVYKNKAKSQIKNEKVTVETVDKKDKGKKKKWLAVKI